jgi:hypothetical protein
MRQFHKTVAYMHDFLRSWKPVSERSVFNAPQLYGSQRQLVASTGARLSAAQLFGCVFVLIYALLVLRHFDAFTTPQFWAEDGLVYFRQREIYGVRGSFFRPFAGYLHTVPRIIVAFIGLLPVRYAPLLNNLAATALEAGCLSLFVIPAFRTVVRSDVLRAALCITAASAIFANELIASLANSIWFLGMPVILGLLLPRDTIERLRIRTAVVVSIGALLFTLTDPQLIVAAPLVLWRSIIARGWKTRAIAACFLSGLVVQWLASRSFTPPPAPPLLSLQWLDAITGAVVLPFFYRAVIGTMFGEQIANTLATGPYSGLTLSLLVIFVGVSTWALLHTPKPSRVHIMILLYTGAATLTLPVILRHAHIVEPATLHLAELRGERHLLLSSWAFIMSVGIVLDGGLHRFRPHSALLMLGVVFAAGAVKNFVVPRLVDFAWPLYPQAIESWLASARKQQPTFGIIIPVNPEGWRTVVLPALFDRWLFYPDSSHATETVCRRRACITRIAATGVTATRGGLFYWQVDGLPYGPQFNVRALCLNESSTPIALELSSHGWGMRFAQSLQSVPAYGRRELTLSFQADSSGRACIHISSNIGSGSVRPITLEIQPTSPIRKYDEID